MQLADTMSDGRLWPRISIVTPSYNQGQFIEETIRSVLLQGYPNLEYIIFDGGSTDNSVEIIKKYEPWLAYWRSEPDRGQSHAINKGFEKGTGDIFGWINSDDYYYPGVLRAIARAFIKHPDVALVHGYEHHVHPDGSAVVVFPPLRDARAVTLYLGRPLLQLTCFWRSEVHRTIGGLDETLHYQLDYEFLLRLTYRYPSLYVPFCMGAFRRYPEQKSQMPDDCFWEYGTVRQRFLRQVEMSAWKYKLLCYWYRGLRQWRKNRVSWLVKAFPRWLRLGVSRAKQRLPAR